LGGAGGDHNGNTEGAHPDAMQLPRRPEEAAEALADTLGGRVLAARWARALVAAIDSPRKAAP
jgi:hypothetical protein